MGSADNVTGGTSSDIVSTTSPVTFSRLSRWAVLAPQLATLDVLFLLSLSGAGPCTSTNIET